MRLRSESKRFQRRVMWHKPRDCAFNSSLLALIDYWRRRWTLAPRQTLSHRLWEDKGMRRLRTWRSESEDPEAKMWRENCARQKRYGRLGNSDAKVQALPKPDLKLHLRQRFPNLWGRDPQNDRNNLGPQLFRNNWFSSISTCKTFKLCWITWI